MALMTPGNESPPARNLPGNESHLLPVPHGHEHTVGERNEQHEGAEVLVLDDEEEEAAEPAVVVVVGGSIGGEEDRGRRNLWGTRKKHSTGNGVRHGMHLPSHGRVACAPPHARLMCHLLTGPSPLPLSPVLREVLLRVKRVQPEHRFLQGGGAEGGEEGMMTAGASRRL